MVCCWRVIRVFMSYRRRGRLGVLDAGVLRLRVWPNDLDLNLHMNNGRFFSLADVGRFDWWLRTGVWNAALKRGWRPVAGDANARFSRSLETFQRYELHTRLLGWDEKWLFSEHRFVRGGQTAATVVVRYLFSGKDGKQPPATVLAAVGHTATSPPLPDWVLAWHEAQNQLTAALKTEAPGKRAVP